MKNVCFISNDISRPRRLSCIIHEKKNFISILLQLRIVQLIAYSLIWMKSLHDVMAAEETEYMFFVDKKCEIVGLPSRVYYFEKIFQVFILKLMGWSALNSHSNKNTHTWKRVSFPVHRHVCKQVYWSWNADWILLFSWMSNIL